ncbi:MAG: phosphoenolpyruvate carboxykinase (GTP) [Polyangiales bacterium]
MSELHAIPHVPLVQWIERMAAHTNPERIHLCDGSDAERARLERAMLEDGTLLPLDSDRHPRSHLHRSDPTDVARTEHLTFISTPRAEDVGPTNHWMSPGQALERVWPLFEGAMRGRTMYVVPYLMGPAGSPYARVGVELTDSPYVVLSLRLMTRMGRVALDHLSSTTRVVRGLHSLGDLSPERRYIVHFPEEREIWSVGSGYGGNALLSKKCHALRIASVEGRDEGWLAEHMLLLGLTSPEGKKHYVAAAFPSACGKTNLAMLVPSLPGWKVDTVGDDICWMHPGPDGRLWAINPENGMFGVAPGTSRRTNPNALESLSHDVLFTNVARRSDGRVYWEGLETLPEGEVLEDWRGQPWTAGRSKGPAAHPNSRFTAPLAQCPSAEGTFDLASGVPISAILFGGRRAKLAPLVYEARSFAHGVYLGATMVSETTAAATGQVGVPRNDPMAMLPFCGYDLGAYFGHWLSVGRKLTRPPRIFHVNWFRTDASGRYLWPGFGDNLRVLAWILERVEGRGGAKESPIGLLPTLEAIDRAGLDVTDAALRELLHVDADAWLEETERTRGFFSKLATTLPRELLAEHQRLVHDLAAARGRAEARCP